jgi:hypothetical protein
MGTRLCGRNPKRTGVTSEARGPRRPQNDTSKERKLEPPFSKASTTAMRAVYARRLANATEAGAQAKSLPPAQSRSLA